MNPGPAMKFAMLNARSMRNKEAILQSLIADQCLDVLAISETWIYDDDPDAIRAAAVPEWLCNTSPM